MLTRTAPAIAAATLAALLLPSGCAEFELVDSQVEEVCVRGVTLPFEGRTDGAVTSAFDVADAGLDASRLVGAVVTLDRVEFRPGPGIANFGFVDAISVDLSARPGDLRLVDIDIDAVASTDGELSAGADTGADLSEHLRDAGAEIAVSITGDVPATPWAAVLDVCLAVDGLAPATD